MIELRLAGSWQFKAKFLVISFHQNPCIAESLTAANNYNGHNIQGKGHISMDLPGPPSEEHLCTEARLCTRSSHGAGRSNTLVLKLDVVVQHNVGHDAFELMRCDIFLARL